MARSLSQQSIGSFAMSRGTAKTANPREIGAISITRAICRHAISRPMLANAPVQRRMASKQLRVTMSQSCATVDRIAQFGVSSTPSQPVTPGRTSQMPPQYPVRVIPCDVLQETGCRRVSKRVIVASGHAFVYESPESRNSLHRERCVVMAEEIGEFAEHAVKGVRPIVANEAILRTIPVASESGKQSIESVE